MNPRHFAQSAFGILLVSFTSTLLGQSAPNVSEDFVNRYFAAYDTDHMVLDRFLELYSDDIRFVDPTFRLDIDGKAALREMYEDAKIGNSDGYQEWHWELNRHLVVGRDVIIEGTWSGVWQGQPFSVRFNTWLTLDEHGKIAKQLDFFDTRSWFEQVGLAPVASDG